MSFSSDQPQIFNQLPVSIDLPKDPEQYHEVQELFMKRVSNVVNTKSGGLYSINEYGNSEQYQVSSTQTTSNVYRKCFNLTDLNGGNIAGGATVAFAHNITGLFAATIIYAGCTSVTPTYFSVMGQPSIYLDAVNINFTNPLPATALTRVFAVCEYTKS